MKVRLTALAEFDLVEAQDFYAPAGAWVDDRFGPARIVAHFGPNWIA